MTGGRFPQQRPRIAGINRWSGSLASRAPVGPASDVPHPTCPIARSHIHNRRKTAQRNRTLPVCKLRGTDVHTRGAGSIRPKSGRSKIPCSSPRTDRMPGHRLVHRPEHKPPDRKPAHRPGHKPGRTGSNRRPCTAEPLPEPEPPIRTPIPRPPSIRSIAWQHSLTQKARWIVFAEPHTGRDDHGKWRPIHVARGLVTAAAVFLQGPTSVLIPGKHCR